MALSTQMRGVPEDMRWIEALVLQLGEEYQIKVLWNRDTLIMSGVLAVAGGFLGGYAGGKIGAAVGAGLGSITGVAVSTMVSLSEIWSMVRGLLKELFYIVLNFLRRLDPVDYERAISIFLACTVSRKELVLTILEFIAHKLGTKVISSITA